MGSLILCHRKKARQPYEIARLHKRIYTVEELCYYICNYLYLIDYTIVNHQLCDWLEKELELKALSEKLEKELNENASVEEFILTILKASTIYAPSEILKIQGTLEQLQNQNEVEREKYKADSLFKSGEYAAAILVYQSIVNKERDDSQDKAFYGHVYACMGAAYGRLLLYAEAARVYQEAYRICDDADMLKAYLYCSFRSLPREQYVKMLSGNPVYLNAGAALREELKQRRKKADLDVEAEALERWKKEYRRIDKN